MLVDKDAKAFLTINTHKGLFRYNHLPYGVSSSPCIFQRTMEGLLQGILSTVVLQDNILIARPGPEEHLDNIERVLERLSNAGLQLSFNFEEPSAKNKAHSSVACIFRRP